MAPVAGVTRFFFLKRDTDGLNFRQHGLLLPRSLSDSQKDIRSAAQRAARDLTPQIILQRLRQVSEFSALISARASGIRHSTGPMTSMAQQKAEPILDDNEDTNSMESFDGIEEDDAMDDVVLIEYPLRHSPECVLLRPVPGVDTHPDYIWKK